MANGSADIGIRVASWNIHGAIGRDGACRPERIAAVLETIGADIVGLQEVDGRTHLRRRPRAFETMARLLGGSIVEARLFGAPGREHGSLVWSRWPILRSAVHLLPGGLEQRGLIEALVETPVGPVAFYATHLGLAPITRRRQAKAILRHVEARGEGLPAILVGDLNEWMPAGPVHRRLRQALPTVLRPATFPARRPFVALDRLYASTGVRATLAPMPGGAADASDHLPLVADIILD